jgi:2-dehydropantoate 2-reductase
MRIAIFGTGGVGGYYGGRLALAGPDVTFIARGEHLRAIQANGLRVSSVGGDFLVHPARATDDAGSVGTVDVVVVALKTWQLPAAMPDCARLVGPKTLVLSLQNGVEAPRQFAARFGDERVLGGVAKIFSAIESPGCIRHSGGAAVVEFGRLDNRVTDDVARLRDVFVQAGVKAKIAADLDVALWEKFLYVAPLGGVGAVTRAPVGIVRSQSGSRDVLEEAMREIWRVGRARGVGLAEDLVERGMRFVDGHPPGATTSMQRDILAGRPSELDAWNGAVVRLGAAAGVPTPVHGLLYASLLPQERRARGEVEFP